MFNLIIRSCNVFYLNVLLYGLAKCILGLYADNLAIWRYT